MEELSSLVSTRVPFLFPPLPPSLPHFSLFPSVSLSLSFSPSFSSIPSLLPSLLPLSSLSSTQLYNLSAEPERKEFLDKLFDYMQKKGGWANAPLLKSVKLYLNVVIIDSH